MPPLRQRKSDIATLAQHFLRRFADEHGRRGVQFTEDALEALCGAPWPGNVRQLENVVERDVVLTTGSRIERNDLPPMLPVRPDPAPESTQPDPSGEVRPLREAMQAPEKRLIEQALEHCSGNREKAARVLGINRSTLFHKLRKYGIR
jgi:DNA-binding NtrC family response regulator